MFFFQIGDRGICFSKIAIVTLLNFKIGTPLDIDFLTFFRIEGQKNVLTLKTPLIWKTYNSAVKPFLLFCFSTKNLNCKLNTFHKS